MEFDSSDAVLDVLLICSEDINLTETTYNLLCCCIVQYIYIISRRKSVVFTAKSRTSPCVHCKHFKMASMQLYEAEKRVTVSTIKADWTSEGSAPRHMTWFPMSTCHASWRNSPAPRTCNTDGAVRKSRIRTRAES